MKKISISSLMIGLVIFAGAGSVSAQDDGMKVIPVELFTCSYKDGKGPSELSAVIEKWNAWMDKEGHDDYAAWTLTPYYYGAEQEFDVIWLGAGKDAVALGKVQDSYIAEGTELQSAFGEVVSCDIHANMASINFKAPPKGATPKDSVMTFSDCNYKDGATFDKLSAAMGGWSKHLSDGGSKAGIWHWYPVYGGGGEEFDFKWISAYKDLADLGADYERYGNGRGFVTRRNLLSHLVSCDSSRAYLAESQRFVQLR